MLRGRVRPNDPSNPFEETESSVVRTTDAGGRAIAWLVHLFTATGAVFGTFALFAIASGRLDVACLLMLASLVIDSVDGTLARAANR